MIGGSSFRGFEGKSLREICSAKVEPKPNQRIDWYRVGFILGKN